MDQQEDIRRQAGGVAPKALVFGVPKLARQTAQPTPDRRQECYTDRAGTVLRTARSCLASPPASPASMNDPKLLDDSRKFFCLQHSRCHVAVLLDGRAGRCDALMHGVDAALVGWEPTHASRRCSAAFHSCRRGAQKRPAFAAMAMRSTRRGRTCARVTRRGQVVAARGRPVDDQIVRLGGTRWVSVWPLKSPMNSLRSHRWAGSVSKRRLQWMDTVKVLRGSAAGSSA